MASIDFRRGHPNPNTCLPFEALAAATQRASQRLLSRQLPLGYGNPVGNDRLILSLAQFLTRNCCGGPSQDIVVNKNGLFITTGISHGIDLVSKVFSSPGDLCLVEDATYFLAAKIFTDNGLKLASVPTDKDGLNVDELERMLQTGAFPQPPKLLYIIPVNSNPRATTLPHERRQKLVALAKQYGFLIIADEVYHCLDWRHLAPSSDPAPARPPRMVYYDPAYPHTQFNPNEGAEVTDTLEDPDASYLDKMVKSSEVTGVVASVSGFTKILSPGVRVGWVEAEPAIIQKLAEVGYIVSAGGFAPFSGEIIAEALIGREADEFLRHAQEQYARRTQLLQDALRQHSIELFTPAYGGYFVWCKLPAGVPADKLLPFAEKEFKVSFLPGSRCDPVGSQHNDSIRLCFAYLSEELLSEGVGRLARAIEAFKNRSPQ